MATEEVQDLLLEKKFDEAELIKMEFEVNQINSETIALIKNVK